MLTTYHHLTRDQRCQIYALNKRGVTQTGLHASWRRCSSMKIRLFKAQLMIKFLRSAIGLGFWFLVKRCTSGILF